MWRSSRRRRSDRLGLNNSLADDACPRARGIKALSASSKRRQAAPLAGRDTMSGFRVGYHSVESGLGHRRSAVPRHPFVRGAMSGFRARYRALEDTAGHLRSAGPRHSVIRDAMSDFPARYHAALSRPRHPRSAVSPAPARVAMSDYRVGYHAFESRLRRPRSAVTRVIRRGPGRQSLNHVGELESRVLDACSRGCVVAPRRHGPLSSSRGHRSGTTASEQVATGGRCRRRSCLG
jgi:hypothetical protein